jgi:methanogenic corrinoid protein MtbC1
MVYVQRAEAASQRPGVGAPDDRRVVPFERPGPGRQEMSPIALARLIEGEIIPRLLLAHQSAEQAEARTAIEGGVGPDDVVDFAHLVLAEDLSVLVQKIEGLIGRGVDVDALYFDLFSPTAKLLGSMWEEDFCTFNDVTVGLCRLQQLVYEFSDRLQPEQTGAGRNALFALTPGDQHSFGLVVVVEFFRRAGWRTVCAAEASASDLVDMVRSESFDLIGFSMSDEKWLDPLPELIASLRAASRNPLVRVIVGGRVFTDRPERVAEVGADETAEDAREAVRSADQLVGKSAVA